METSIEIKKKIRDYIVETSYADPSQVKDESLIFVEGIFDSMGFIMLIGFIEETFAFKAKDSELLEDNFESINAIAQFVENKLSLTS
ncbi:MAG: acyl carrier protein [Ginsengibacter sp.]